MRKVLRIMVRRTVNAAITIFGILCLNYVLIRLMPGNAEANLAPHNPQYAGYLADNIRTFGLDRSPEEQFVIYRQNAFTFNWGISYYWKQPVADLLLHDLSWTLLLVGTSTIFTTLIGMVVGSFAAVRRGKPFDLISTGGSIFLYGMPIFWLGIMLQLTFEKNSVVSHYFRWLPGLPTQGYWDPANTGFPQVCACGWLRISNVSLRVLLPAVT